MKKILCLILALTLLLVGCTPAETPSSETSSEQTISDEQALEVLKDLMNKRDIFGGYIFAILDFGPYNIDGLETFEENGNLFAEFRFSNFYEYKTKDGIPFPWDEDEYNFTSIEQMYELIETFEISAENSRYKGAIDLSFKERDGKLFYNTSEYGISLVLSFYWDSLKIVEKTDSKIVFYAEVDKQGNMPHNFSLVKNSDGEWRFSGDYV